MSRKNKLADLDPFGRDDQSGGQSGADDRPRLTMSDADLALFGELSKRETARHMVRSTSIFSVYPDPRQPRRAVPSNVRAYWSGEPKDIADLFNAWLQQINKERKIRNQPRFNLDDVLWAESVERQARKEGEHISVDDVGPIERSFLQVVDLAVSIRRDGLANPITIQRISGSRYRLETGERRWLAFHILYGYFNGTDGKPNEHDRWESIPAIVVENFSVWRQASENAARADLNAIGRARQFSILLMDLLEREGEQFQAFETVIKAGKSEREYYAQVREYRVPTGKSDMLSNGLGVSHRAVFSRCRALLGLPDEVWTIGDNLDLTEDDLLRIAKIEPESEAIAEARRIAEIVATRNNSTITPATTSSSRSTSPSPTLFTDPALKRGKKLFSKGEALLAKEIFDIRDGVGGADAGTKLQLRQAIDELRQTLKRLEDKLK
jgi:hypothetical protein